MAIHALFAQHAAVALQQICAEAAIRPEQGIPGQPSAGAVAHAQAQPLPLAVLLHREADQRGGLRRSPLLHNGPARLIQQRQQYQPEIAGGQTGVNIETIRYYEKIGLLPEPTRTAAGYRQYGEDHLRRLRFIRRGRDLGFSIEAIRALLRLAEHPADRVYTNDPARLGFAGCENLEAIEAVFAPPYGRT